MTWNYLSAKGNLETQSYGTGCFRVLFVCPDSGGKQSVMRTQCPSAGQLDICHQFGFRSLRHFHFHWHHLHLFQPVSQPGRVDSIIRCLVIPIMTLALAST
jgi:hypothetical protein